MVIGCERDFAHAREISVRKFSRADTSTSPLKRPLFDSEQDGSASGFAWVAREPKLMCGAKGRASSLRSIDYHNPACFRQHKSDGKINPRNLSRAFAGADSRAIRSVSYILDAEKGYFGANSAAPAAGCDRANPHV
jgi:hypothetical protein